MLGAIGGGPGAIDVFDFVLAESLGMTLGQVRAMPNVEYVQWRAFYKVRHALQNMRQQVPERAGR